MRSRIFALIGALGFVALATPTAKAPQPVRTGHIERATVSRILVDVEVTDEQGRPIPGLTRREFRARLDWRRWPIASVDDLCGCAPAGAQEAANAAAPAEERPPEAEANESGASSTTTAGALWIFYLDFSELQPDGVSRATKEMSRWARETMQKGDRVMLAGFSTGASLEVLQPPTGDRGVLLRRVSEIAKDAALLDPFPAFRDRRIAECYTDRRLCRPHAMAEYDQARRSATAFRHFLEGLATLPGRKMIFLVHQNGNVDPGSFYEFQAPDHARHIEQLSAEATLSRATVYSAFVGDRLGSEGSEAMALGADLADYTGGRYNRTASGLAQLTDEARLGCHCVYRIGIEPPEHPRRGTYPLQILLGRRLIAPNLRVRILDEAQQWMRRARAVLSRPDLATDLPLAVGLVPQEANGSTWSLKAQVGVDLGSLAAIPGPNGTTGMWEVGALLVRDDGRRHWEMQSESELHSARVGTLDTWVVHAHSFENMQPGRYRLTAFVRDRTLNVFGGGEAELDLPDPGMGGIAGPMLERIVARRISSPLNLAGDRAADAVSRRETEAGGIPAGSSPIHAGDPFVISTWLCPREGKGPAPEVPLRYIAQEGRPIARLGSPEIEPAGRCRRLRDSIGGWAPEAGHYTYNLVWQDPLSLPLDLVP